jgi:DNA-binding transcriptional LysR family regulator
MSIPPVPSALEQMLWFVRIVEAGSFAEAARRSRTSTSAMSKAVSRLERAQGVRLLNRTTHSLSVTPEGERLLTVGRKLLDELEEAQGAFAEIGHQGSVGRVRIGAPRAFARRCIMPRLPQFLRANPAIAIEMEFTSDFLNMAVRGIDLAIGSGDISGLPGHFVRELCTFPWVACGSPEYFRKHGTPVTPADLSDHELVGYRNPVTGQLDSWRFSDPTDGRAVWHLPRPRHTFDDPDAAWEMIRGGFGIGFGPAWMGLDDWEQGTVVETLREWRCDAFPLYVVRLDKRLTPKRIHVAQEFVVELTRAWQEAFAVSRVAGNRVRPSSTDSRGPSSARAAHVRPKRKV